ncbi:MAG TPA: FHA domain-containing protein, partial [Candidatus Obscuribacterales bacterium]
LVSPDPLVQPQPFGSEFDIPEPINTGAGIESTNVAPELPATVVSQPLSAPEASVVPPPLPAPEVSAAPPPVRPPAGSAKTQLQQQTAQLLHIQTNTLIELPQNLSVIHMGKPNDQIPPDVDVSGFPSSEIVSRIHADIRVEGGAYYIEDVGSSNGTYINHNPLASGNRHRLRPGDRIGLGKGDMMTFLFQLSS